MKRVLVFMILLCTVSFTYAQCYEDAVSKAATESKRGDYDKAVKRLQNALSTCPDVKQSAEKKSHIQKLIADYKNSLEKSKQKTDKTQADKTQPKVTKYLRLDGDDSEKNYQFAANGDTRKKVKVACSESYSFSELPSWCHTQDQTNSGFTLLCDANTSSSSRSGSFVVRGGGKSVTVQVRQSGVSKQATPMVEVTSIKAEQNKALSDGLGMEIHLSFSAKNMSGKDGRVIAYFYDADGNAIKDINDTAYGTVGDPSYVATGKSFTPSNNNMSYSDFVLSIPYSELHQAGYTTRRLKYRVSIWNKSTSPSELVYSGSNYYYFDYTPEAVLTVDGSTSDKMQKFSSEGGRITFNVNAGGESFETWGIPSWCNVVDKTTTGFTLVCFKNPYNTPRNDYMKVKAGGKEIRIDVSQAAGMTNVSGSNSYTYRRGKFNSPSRNYKVSGLSLGYVSKQWVYKNSGMQEKWGIWTDSKNVNGLQVGYRIEPLWSYGFGLNTGLFYELYYTKTDDLEIDGDWMEASVMEHSLYLPLHLEYRLHFSRGFQVFFYGGVGLDYGLGGTVKITDPSGYYEDWESSELYSGDNFSNWKRFNTSLEYGVGLRAGSVQFQFQMSKGLTNMSEEDDYDVYQNKNIMATMSIMF